VGRQLLPACPGSCGHLDTSRTGNAQTGEYALTGGGGSTSTAVEVLSHGGYGTTFTETLTDDSTRSEGGNEQSGEYSLSEGGTRAADFVDDGVSSGGDTFHVTEGSSGTYSRTKVGNTAAGDYSLTETSDTGYSWTEVEAGSLSEFTLSGSGDDSATAAESGDTLTGEFTSSENGTDLYTLVESGDNGGGSLTESVTGTDIYSSSGSGNRDRGSFDGTTTGGGDWTRISSGAGAVLASGSGTNGYTLTESDDSLAGHFSQTRGGTDRYGLLDYFGDVSNSGPGATPGNVTFHSHGLPFRDPGPMEGPSQLVVPKDQAQMWVQKFKAAGVEVQEAPYDLVNLSSVQNQRYARIVLPASAQSDMNAHNAVAGVLAGMGVSNTANTTGADTVSDLAQAMRALYRGSVGASPGGYADRFLSTRPAHHVIDG
jgi:hypothetical protein